VEVSARSNQNLAVGRVDNCLLLTQREQCLFRQAACVLPFICLTKIYSGQESVLGNNYLTN